MNLSIWALKEADLGDQGRFKRIIPIREEQKQRTTNFIYSYQHHNS